MGKKKVRRRAPVSRYTSSIVFTSISDLSKMSSRHISRYVAPDGYSVDPSAFVPQLLRGEIAQGFLTVTYAQRRVRYETLGQRSLTKVFLTQLL